MKLIFLTVRKAKQNHILPENFILEKDFSAEKAFIQKNFSYMC